MADGPPAGKKGSYSPGSQSLFGAIVLIAIGIYFLLYNLNRIPVINWTAVWQLWPLFLIFLGLNILVVQLPRPWGSLLSILVALGAVAVFSMVAFSDSKMSFLRQVGFPAEISTRVETVSYPGAELTAAEINLDLSHPPTELGALPAGDNLLEAQVAISGSLQFQTSAQGGQATITLAEAQDPLDLLNLPRNLALAAQDLWRIGLNPDVPLDLNIDLSSGAANLDLSTLTLRDLQLKGSSGALSAVLPDGDYEVSYDAASGVAELWLAPQGNQRVNIDGASGGLRILVPSGRAVRLELEGGSGGARVPEDLFTRVSGTSADSGVWETPAYDRAAERIDLTVHIGSGRLLLEERNRGGR